MKREFWRGFFTGIGSLCFLATLIIIIDVLFNEDISLDDDYYEDDDDDFSDIANIDDDLFDDFESEKLTDKDIFVLSEDDFGG